jgi:nucleotidyltransferase substrate binding protein (TIGR01987 family)
MPLDLSSFEKAVNSLDKALYIAEKNKANNDILDVIRAGVIQNFEFTYELCWKFIKRWLEINGEGSMIDGVTRKELFRIAGERQIINNVENWLKYTQSRNETAHTYDNNTAIEVFESAKKFITDAKFLLKKLKEKND